VDQKEAAPNPSFRMNYHTSVLLEEVVSHLQPRAGGLYVDATVGGGGHTAALLRASAPDGRVIGLDWDDEALATSRERLREWGDRLELVASDFGQLQDVLTAGRVTEVDGVLFDLGVSSRHLDEPSRGFSFLRDGPLDMRMSPRTTITARELLATASAEELVRILAEYGEERRARAIARRIEFERERQPLETTTQLARLVERVLGPQRGRIHPATRTFQALRIAVNDELGQLRRGLAAAVAVLKPGGRVAVISFHSLEDRIVKWFFRGEAGKETPTLRIVTKKPVVPGDEEMNANPRARSAKLRVAEKL
jgi:16S rRNA (cytosine1402-N4)-methyltransferase